ncbi:hypothetical protein [Pseudomonas sp. A-B-19]|uniref:hypothetical protein n=1 Tax=Pseudomonas sp. A-B-19 TaxID=2832405 RepID=UPI001CBB6644|nr:hypothetical protein [Pseudomonas sp. A-B-19]
MDKSKILLKFKNLPIQDIQLYGSLCLKAYCEQKELSHPAIFELLNHLEMMHSSKNLPEWDSKGALLALNGRGDDIPTDLEDMLIQKKATDFTSIIDNVVEIGIVDLYGGKTNLPIQFLERALEILEKNNTPLPLPNK